MPLRLALFALILVSSAAVSQNTLSTADTSGVLPPPSVSHPAQKIYHDHTIRDIDAIGNRNVGCGRGLGNWYSLDRQISMGKQYSAEVESTSKLLKDPEILEYVNRIGQNLVRNSDSLVPFTIKVIDSDDVNAFALPGGFFYVDSGLILAAESEAELAGVMAHEIAHVAACHAARGHTRGQLMNLASLPLMMIGGPVGYVAYESLTIATPLTYFKFSRKFEAEADFLGVQYMYKAGYDPQALTAFFERVRSMEKRRRKQGTVARAFQTHPQTPERIEKTQEEIATMLPPETQYRVDTSEFQDMKARLSKLENPRGMWNPKTPTLHRRVSVDEPGQSSERPELPPPF
jgi:beta-barrel assembly-enhancing protease